MTLSSKAVLPTLLIALAAMFPLQNASATVVGPSGITGFNPTEWTLNANANGFLGQSAAQHGVPSISGSTLYLDTNKGVTYNYTYLDDKGNLQNASTFEGSENGSAYYNIPQNISTFTATFTYKYGGTNPASFGPGNGFTFIIQNDSLNALGTSGFGNGPLGDPNTVAPSVAVEFNLFTGFGQAVGTQVAINGDYGPFKSGSNSYFLVPGGVKLLSGDPIQVVLSYSGTTLTETLTDETSKVSWTVTHSVNIESAIGGSTAYVGFTGGTGAAVANQSISNFTFTNTATTVPPPPASPTFAISDASGAPLITTYAAGNTTYETIVGAVITPSGENAENFVVTNATFTSSAGTVTVEPGTVPTIPNLLTVGTGSVYDFRFSYPNAGAIPTTGTLAIYATYTNPVTNATATWSSSIRGVTISTTNTPPGDPNSDDDE